MTTTIAWQSLARAPLSLAPDAPPPFGRYLGPIADLQLARWDETRWARRRLERKVWLYFGCYSEDLVFGMAMIDAGYTANAFAYVYDCRSGEYVEEKAMVPFGFPTPFTPSLDQSWQLARGRRRWQVQPYANGWELSFHGKRISLQAEAEHAFAGLTALAPAASRPFNYTYKLASVPGRARISVDGRQSEVEGSSFSIDFTAGYPPRRTFWNWAAACCTTERGEALGLNLVAPFNDGLENGLWLAGKLMPLPKAQFAYDRHDRRAPWRVKTADDRLQLTFEPLGERAESIHLGFLMSRFRQPFGRFEGTWDSGQELVKFRGTGVVEEHHALW